MIVIQKIESRWTKQSRGYPNSEKRSEVKEVFSFSLNNYYNDESIVLQTITCNEASDFQPTISEKEINQNQVRQEQLELSFADSKLSVGFWGRNSHFGKAKPISALKQNQWLQIIQNERYPLEYTTGYKKVVYNVSFMDAKLRFDISKNPPIISKDFQNQLY